MVAGETAAGKTAVPSSQSRLAVAGGAQKASDKPRKGGSLSKVLPVAKKTKKDGTKKGLLGLPPTRNTLGRRW
jgi:hypothetical protein